jgi:Piwi domain
MNFQVFDFFDILESPDLKFEFHVSYEFIFSIHSLYTASCQRAKTQYTLSSICCPVLGFFYKILRNAEYFCRYDFYIVSQTVREGTVGPTYYDVLVDDSNMPPEVMQTCTYMLCHMYFNWPVRFSCLSLSAQLLETFWFFFAGNYSRSCSESVRAQTCANGGAQSASHR